VNELAVIFGLEGPKLSAGERAFFRDSDPWAFILFARNIESPGQVKRLTDDLRDVVGRDCLIFVDQEGGRVARFRPPHWRPYPSMALLAQDYDTQPSLARRAVYLHHRLIADDLRAMGVTANCAPVLDIPRPDADPIISDRAFGNNPNIVIDLGHAAMAGLMEGGVAPVIKHIPGHGRAKVDSHKALPKIRTNFSDMRKTDFAPFKALNSAPMAMTAHAIYEAVDKQTPVTLSTRALPIIIRTEIGFHGLLMSDDLDMRALSGHLTHRTERALKAGCDVALQCSGNMPDMVDVAKGAARLDGVSKRRADIALLSAEHVDEFDREDAEAEFDGMLGQWQAVA